jgi:hypothetical protein
VIVENIRRFFRYALLLAKLQALYTRFFMNTHDSSYDATAGDTDVSASNSMGTEDAKAVPNESILSFDTSLLFADIRSELLIRQARINDAWRAMDAFYARLNAAPPSAMTVPKRIELHHLEVATDEIREANLEYLFSVTDSFGFPDAAMVGIEAAQAAWSMLSIVTESDLPRVSTVVDKLLSGKRSEFPGINEILYLADFCLVIAGLEQRFGTLWYVEIGVANALLPYPSDVLKSVHLRPSWNLAYVWRTRRSSIFRFRICQLSI